MVARSRQSCFTRQTARRALAALAVTFLLTGGYAGSVDAAEATAWLVGRPLEERLAAPVGVAWAGTPLRATLANLAQSQRVAIWLDRRVDPGVEINLSVDATPLRNILSDVARRRGLGVGRFNAAVVYLGPPGALTRLRTTTALRRQEAKQLPPAAVRKFAQARPMRWDDFATPRELLAELARSSDIRLDGADRVSHDLWPAADLPAMSLVDRLALILGQFDLTFDYLADGQGVRVVPMPGEVASAAGRAPAETWEEASPAAQDRKATAGKEAAGLAQTRIERFTVENQPLDDVLRQVTARLKLELRIDEDALRRSGKSLNPRISVRVEKVTVEQLFDAILKPQGLAFRLQGSTLEVFPAQ